MVNATTASEWEEEESSISFTPKEWSRPKVVKRDDNRANMFKNLTSPRRSPRRAKNCERPDSQILPRRSPRAAKGVYSTSNFHKSPKSNMGTNQPSTSRSIDDPPLTKRKLIFRDQPGKSLLSIL